MEVLARITGLIGFICTVGSMVSVFNLQRTLIACNKERRQKKADGSALDAADAMKLSARFWQVCTFSWVSGLVLSWIVIFLFFME